MAWKNPERGNPPTKRNVGQKYKYIYSSYCFSRLLRAFFQFLFVPDKNHFDRDKKVFAYFCPADKNPSVGR